MKLTPKHADSEREPPPDADQAQPKRGAWPLADEARRNWQQAMSYFRPLPGGGSIGGPPFTFESTASKRSAFLLSFFFVPPLPRR